MIDIKFSSFFDRAAVIKAVDDGSRKGLSKIGAYVMTAARRSIRRSKKSSKPGQPPSSHVGQLRDLLFFGWDFSTKSVVVGPQLLNGRSSPTIPQVLEYGGTLKSWKSGAPVNYAAFPYMGPAYQSVQNQVPQLFANVVGS